MSLTPALLWLSLSLVTAGEDDHRYCSLRYRRLCQGKGMHVACQFPYPGPGESCENYTQITFTEDLQNFVTHYINRKRQRLAAGLEKVRGGLPAPAPAVMMLVEWDRELATLAQRLADQCNFVHDECRATVRYPYAGQTVGAVRWRAELPPRRAARRAVGRVLDAWWGERRRVLPHQLTQPFTIDPKGSVWGHFSQLAVWSLRAVGCGAALTGGRGRRGARPHLLLACDHSTTNLLGRRTLPPGPRSVCPPHAARRPSSRYPLLCAPVRRPGRLNQNFDDPHEDQYETYEDEIELEPTTKSTTEFTTETVAKTKVISTNTALEPETDISLTTVLVRNTKEEVTQKPKYKLELKVPNNVVRKDEQFDPLVHREGKQSYQLTTRGHFVGRLQEELEGRTVDQTERYQQRYTTERMWRNSLSAYSDVRKNQERLAENYDRRKLPYSSRRDRYDLIKELSNEQTDLEEKFYDTEDENDDRKVQSHYEPKRKEHDNPLIPRKQLSVYPEKQIRIQESPVEEKETFKPGKFLYESIVHNRKQDPKVMYYKPDRPVRVDVSTGNKLDETATTQDHENSERRQKDHISESPAHRKDPHHKYHTAKNKLKHNRGRPIGVRPSAHAQSQYSRPLERGPLIALKMEQDDVDQLIRDTGFNPFEKLTKS